MDSLARKIRRSALLFSVGQVFQDVKQRSLGPSARNQFTVYLERSRSGNGAHVWFFFSGPVPASTVRKMGCHLLTETLSRRHQLGMDSYDRLFPSQNTLPRGGLGNLIALPLQREVRLAANSVFLDDRLRPFPDDQQWAYLASLCRIDPAEVERIASRLLDRGPSSESGMRK